MPEPAIDISFQIQAIQVTDFAIHEPANAPQPKTVSFNLQLRQLHTPETENWMVEIQVSLSEAPEEPTLASLTVECQYRLTGYVRWLAQLPVAEHSPSRNAGSPLPTSLAVTLNSISISTVRGILFERLAGTPWQSAILPIIDPLAFQIAE